MNKLTFGVIVGNRGFFPDELANEGRKNILDVLKNNGYGAVVLSNKDTKYGAVETLGDAVKCAELFAQNAGKIAGIIVTLPNFGDERGVLETIRRSGLNVPILIHAEPDTPGKMDIKNRRDSFCGKISACNNLTQAGIPYSLTRSHTLAVKSQEFAKELDDFASVCNIVGGLKSVRFGAIGSRPAAFNTVRYSEKILEAEGVSVEPIDLYEILGWVERTGDNEAGVKRKLRAIKQYVAADAIPADALLKMAKFGYVIDKWVKDLQLNGTAIQCWTALEQFFGVVPCTLMSMMSQSLLPSACEVDVTGLLGMYVLQLASGKPSALLDWNNNYGDDGDKCVLFHCSNVPKALLESAKMDYQAIIAGTVGQQNTYGTVVGRIAAGPVTFCRPTTDDTLGEITVYVGQGEFTNDKLQTFGGYGVMKVAHLQALLQYVCKGGFEHHVAANLCQKADAIAEALSIYRGWQVYHHT